MLVLYFVSIRREDPKLTIGTRGKEERERERNKPAIHFQYHTVVHFENLWQPPLPHPLLAVLAYTGIIMYILAKNVVRPYMCSL